MSAGQNSASLPEMGNMCPHLTNAYENTSPLPAVDRSAVGFRARPRPVYDVLLEQIRQRAAGFAALADGQLAGKCRELREHVIQGMPVTALEIVVPCFALVQEAARRTTGLVFYDVQLSAGLVLSTGAIADIKTGEGKTLIITLPASLHALSGNGVHVATVNAYLADRDFTLLRPVYELLGFTVGISRERDSPANKRQAYQCDITYATGYELGFDYLRDQTRLRAEPTLGLGQRFRLSLRGVIKHRTQTMQRKHAMVIIDEADSVLIDEANTPLILSGVDTKATDAAHTFQSAREVALSLAADRHFAVLPDKRRVSLTDLGLAHVYESVRVPGDGIERPWSVYIENALSAEHVFRKDVDYVIRDGKVRIVDQYTGRIFADRTWRDGLHQAVEVKESVAVSPANASLARISRQRYFRLYDSLCGLTGTAAGLEEEFRFFYGLSVVLIPERVPCRRTQLPTRFFANVEAKLTAIAADVRVRNERGQPVLVGTRTIDDSLRISRRLRALSISHTLLNGLQDESEADLVSRAGHLGAVTIATNMAGRGTDIQPPDEALRAGGLHVVATERQESQRVDRQLIGRAARQGNPGSCQFFVSSDDELLTRHGAVLARRIANSCDAAGESQTDWTAAVRRVQQMAERLRYEARRALFQQDQQLNEVLSTVAERDRAPTDEEIATGSR